MTNDEIARNVDNALRELFEKDGDLLERNVAERAIAATLKQFMVPQFPDHNVDAEYDKHGIDPKRLTLPPECRGGGNRRVIPDVIVHHRGNDDFNLLAVEIKKETNTEPRDCDRAKLRAIRRELGYQAAVLIDLPAGPNARNRSPTLEWL